MNNIKFTYMKTPLYRYTFKNKKVRKWVEENVEGRVLNLFAGKYKLICDETRNDIRTDMPCDYHMDALEFVKRWEGEKFNTIILDPPYAYRKSMEMYDGAVSSPFNQIKNEIGRILYSHGIVISFGYHCLDEKTQCLTKNGWKYYYELNENDKIASFNRENENIEYNIINDLFIYDYDGILKSISDRHLDQLITPNHKIVLKYKHQNNDKKGNNITWKDDEWNLVKCEDITSHSGIYIPVSGLYNNDKSIGIEMAELIGWIISEGHMTSTRSIFIYQSNSRNKEKVERIRYLLKKCNLFFTDKSYIDKPDLINFYISKRKNKSFYKMIDKLLDDVKNPKWNLLHLKYEELKALFYGLVMGDGSRYTHSSCIFYQKSDYCREWFQVLCCHLGYRTVNNMKNKVVNVTFTNEKHIASGKRFRKVFREKYYKGKIWCVNVKNNCFVIRRNNKISITGNSNVMGKTRNYKQEHILLLSHGGAIHDTIAVIERRNDGLTKEEIGVFF